MEIKITKKTFIVCLIITALCITSFFAGRFIRFKGISGSSEELVGGIILTGNTADSVLDRLGISRFAGQSASDLGYAVSRGIEKLQRSNETARVCIDELNREIAITQQNIEIIKSSFDDVSDSIQLGFRLAEEQAGAYERIIKSLQQFNNDFTEDEQESVTGLGDSK